MDSALSAPADLVLVGGVVHTLTPQRQPHNSAEPDTGLAVRAGRVVEVGPDVEMRRFIGPATQVIELDGRGVIPGINDGHLHATWLGALWPDTLFGSDGPAGAVPERPLTTPQQQRAAILRAGDLLTSLGITSYTEPGLGPGEDGGPTGAFGSSVADQYRRLAATGELRLRVTVLSLYGLLDGASDLDSFRAGIADPPASGDRHRLNFAGVKIFADGIPPMNSAYTHACYSDGSRASLLVHGDDDADRERNFIEMVRIAHRAGLQVGVHATGDRAIELTLDAVVAARAERDVDLGHYVIHGDLVTGTQLRRMAALGVGLSTQAGIAVRTSGMLVRALGAAGVGAWPLQAALDAGIPLCLTSDSPVLAPDWRREIAAADEWMGPALDSRARMDTLLRCYTVHPARQDGASAWKGTLARGMAADLCVLAADPLALTPAELPDVEVDLTVIGGEVVHERQAQVLA